MDWMLEARIVPEKGRGVFPGVAIPANHIVLKFEGPVFTRKTCPNFEESIQIGIDAWMHSSGGMDDLVNHSCNPNTGLHEVHGDLYLLSLRDIAPGEEISYDYSTSMVDDPSSMIMVCCCGDEACRGTIGNFLDMPKEMRDLYAQRGVIPMHVVQAAHERDISLPLPCVTAVIISLPVPALKAVNLTSCREESALVPATETAKYRSESFQGLVNSEGM